MDKSALTAIETRLTPACLSKMMFKTVFSFKFD